MRSALLSHVRQRGTSPEIFVGLMLRTLGMAYRCNVRALPGSPDFANRRRRWAVFVNGCFWHHHKGCVRGTTPKRNRDFWLAKFSANRARDARSIRSLRAAGFDVKIIWECETQDIEQITTKLLKMGKPRRI